MFDGNYPDSMIFDEDQWISTLDCDTLIFDCTITKACFFDERKGFSTL